MSCEMCHTYVEQVRELEAQIRYLKSKLEPVFTVQYMTNPDPEKQLTWLNNKHFQ